MNNSTFPRRSRGDEDRSLLIAKYPIRILYCAEFGVILGCLLALGIQTIKTQCNRLEQVAWEEVKDRSPSPLPPVNHGGQDSADRDSDGIPNDWETVHSHNPDFSADAASDFDDDGLTALQEYQLWQRTSGKSGNPLGKWKNQEIPLVQTQDDTSEYEYFYQNSYVSAANDRGDVIVQFYHHGQKHTGNWLSLIHI
jgi:hypothetical protein